MAKKGFFFTIDAFFGAVLIALALILSSRYFISVQTTPQVQYYAQDIIDSLSNIRISEINDPYVQSLISNGLVSNENNTLLEQIGEFYVLNETEYATNLTRIITENLVPGKFGFEISMNDETIYINSSVPYPGDSVSSSRRLISGIEKYKPLKGATSKVFLEGINSKKFSSFLYFGGFIGQGNITQNVTDIPFDANITNIQLELDVGGEFDIYINDQFCDNLDPVSGDTIAERWDLTSCKTLFVPGVHNKVDILFQGPLNESYIAGGFMKIDYKTAQLSDYFQGYKIRYSFPGIYGVVNLFDAFYVPGTVESMNMWLHFKTNETSYLTIGGKIIHKWDGSPTDQTYNITNDDLNTSEYFNLADDYPLFSNNTVPIRFASYESITYTITGGDADVVLITDLSGSMKKAVDSWNMGNSAPDCNNYVDNSDTRRTRASVCLDSEFTDILMNYTGNRMWPIFLRDNQIVDYAWNPESSTDVSDTISNYYNDQGKGKTCLACAINLAYDILDEHSNSSRKKFIVLMTDGVPTHCASGDCTSTSTQYGTQQCQGLCDTSGSCDYSDIAGQCSACTSNHGAVDNSLASAQRARDDLNVTFYTIGFGPVTDCAIAGTTLQQIATIGNGTYQHSSDVDELRDIYRNISYDILEKVEQESQAVNIVQRGNISESTMYPDSYIEINYVPIAEQPTFEEISVAIENPKFQSCSPTFDIPSGLRVTDAKVTSYSGTHWTDSVVINGKTIYNLTDYFLNFIRLGDPFFVYVPINNIINGTNSLTIETADSPDNKTGCSYNDTIIYTGLIRSSISYADVLPRSDGCNWTLEFEDGQFTNVLVPKYYSGSKTCSYTNANISYDMNDSIDSAAYQLFDNLDYDDDGRIFVNIDEFNLVVNAISVQKIPYPWGPAIAEVKVWK